MQEEIIIDVRKKFNQILTVDDLTELLNFIYVKLVDTKRKVFKKNHIKSEKIAFLSKHLLYYGYVLRNGEGYSNFNVLKKTGGSRKISAPKFTLKVIQQCILELLHCLYVSHDAAHGFVRNKSIVSNAAKHVGKRFVFNIDLKGFFPSVHFGRVRKVLEMPPFNLSGERRHLATFKNPHAQTRFRHSVEQVAKNKPSNVDTGFCIRTGKPIPFNPKRPLSDDAYQSWSKFSNPDYLEKFCHFSGEPSNGETTFSRPIMKKNWGKAKEVHGI